VKVAGGITARVSLDPPTFVAGLYGHLIFQLTDTNTGRPITDLQTYLGAFGHTLIMSEDMLDYVHSHSLDILATGDDDAVPQFVIPPGADLETLRGGPEVTFDGLMPKPGRYRAWTQFRRDDVVHTFTTTFSVVAP
jgi:Cu+-exporting ATPase